MYLPRFRQQYTWFATEASKATVAEEVETEQYCKGPVPAKHIDWSLRSATYVFAAIRHLALNFSCAERGAQRAAKRPGMNLTDYHAKYFAHELTKRSPSDSVEKLAGALADAQVDLNPHQIEAALFAFRNPFSRGAILADEVGLGKTIEAGLLLSQRWAERQRKLLVIVPANLRKQWNQELADKFHLPSTILENRTFNEAIRTGNLNPFSQNSIVLCSYQFVRTKEPYVRQVAWDLVVIDEAHRLRNVYKTSSRIAAAIKQATAPFPKLLLTATPLQNSLLELYGLVSIIDDYAFGDLKSFRARFARVGSQADFTELKERLKPICKRTLRRQVLEYVPYTNRHALVQEFVPSPDEQKLYDLVSDYLQRPTLYALPAGQRQLMTLILRKLLASSTYAISGTLDGLAKKLEQAAISAESVMSAPDGLSDNLENFDELADEWEEEAEAYMPAPGFNPGELAQLREELEQLHEFRRLAASIIRNSKGDVLLTALRRGFAAAAEAQGSRGTVALQQKAIIFTESRRTQDYLFRVLEQTEFKGRVMIFNGVNSDPGSKTIYRRWAEKHAGTDRVTGSPSADLRAALVDYFRDEASILIATEAAAEGINLQFCNLVVNYDLPWNPQRIEQRIGRCHRYGQKFDVVVVNFLNKTNAADQRVYQLLDQKFQLFNGVFGASDEVLGAVESGVDFEKRIATIYQKCRSPEQIQFEFDQLQKELEADIAEGQQDAREKLLDNFDQEVIEKVRIQSHHVLDRFNHQLWTVTRHVLAKHADFTDSDYCFMLHDNPFPGETIHPGPYRIGKNVEDANTYRVGHPLAQRVLSIAKASPTHASELVFDLSNSGKNIAILSPFVGRSGWLRCIRMSVAALEVEDHLLFAAAIDGGGLLDDAQCRRLFDLSAKDVGPCTVLDDVNATLFGELTRAKQVRLEEMGARHGHWFDVEIEKLEHWAEDRRTTLKAELDELDEALKHARRNARTAPTLPEKLECQREVRKLEGHRDEAWRAFDQATRDLEKQKDALLDDIAKRLEQRVEEEQLFVLRWRVV